MKKDQSFFLCHMDKSVLPYVEFPVGSMMKAEVKRLAVELNLDRIARKEESNGMMHRENNFFSQMISFWSMIGMGLCFIGKRKFSRFISQYLPDQVGLVKSIETNETLGEHRGLHYYTLGQRITPIAGKHRYKSTKPFFIAKKDQINNIIYVVRI